MEKATKLTSQTQFTWHLRSKNVFTFTILLLMSNVFDYQTVSAVSNVHVEKLHIFAKLQYRYGHTKVFCQMHNNASKAEEAVFAMVLPNNAFITLFKMEIDDQMYSAYIKERAEANDDYTKARGTGKTAGIINEENNLFNISINLEANKTVLFHLEYEEEVILTSGLNAHYEYAVSVVPQEVEVKHFCVDIDIVEFKNLSIKAVNLCNSSYSCMTVDLEKESVLLHRGRRARIIWEPTTRKMQELLEKKLLGKFNIVYEFNESETLNEILINDGFFMHRFSPRGLKTIPVHVIFVLDISESMTGHRIEQLTKAMLKILGDLKPLDYFSIVTFSSSSKIFRAFPEGLPAFPADAACIESAKNLIRNLKDHLHGSTNIYAALMDALHIAKQLSWFFENQAVLSKPMDDDSNHVQPTPIIFFLTDGFPTSGLVEPFQILEKVRESNNISVPIFSLAFGSTADYSLLSDLSQQNGGIARRVYDNAEAADILSNFYNFVASPVLKNLTFHYTSKMKLLDLTLEKEPWLSVMGEISVAGRIEADHHYKMNHKIINATVTGQGSNDTLEFKVWNCICGGFCTQNPGQYVYDQIKLPGDENPSIDTMCGDRKDQESPFLERFWVYKWLRKLIVQESEGNAAVKEQILKLALQYNFVTPFTSLVVVKPYDPAAASNKEVLQSRSMSGLLNRDRNKEDASLLGLTKPKHTNIINYSVGNSSVLISPVKRETLSMSLETLVSEQEKSIELANQERKAAKKEKRLNLDDILWLNSTGYKMTLVNRGKSYNFTVLKSLERPQESFPTCKVGNDTVGKCTHLLNCVQRPYLNHRELFVKTYFCPLIGISGSFVGTCCSVSAFTDGDSASTYL